MQCNVGMGKSIVGLFVLVIFGIRDGSPQFNSTGIEHAPEGRQLDSEDYVFYESTRGSFKMHRTPAAWRDARLICFDEGAELASPENQPLWIAMSKVLQTSVQPPLRVFTGINDLYAKGFFNTLGGTPLSAMPAHWAPGEPDSINSDENCLVMQRNGMLLDSKCDDTYPYICFKRHPPKQDTLCGTKGNGYVYEKTTRSCYKFHSVPTTWPDAYARCSCEGGYLAIINSNIEGDVISRQFPEGHVWAHIGYTFWRKDLLWVTIHGQTLAEAGFERWAIGEPNNYNTEHCGAVANDATLNDLDCLRMMSYLCEKKPNLM